MRTQEAVKARRAQVRVDQQGAAAQLPQAGGQVGRNVAAAVAAIGADDRQRGAAAACQCFRQQLRAQLAEDLGLLVERIRRHDELGIALPIARKRRIRRVQQLRERAEGVGFAAHRPDFLAGHREMPLPVLLHQPLELQAVHLAARAHQVGELVRTRRAGLRVARRRMNFFVGGRNVHRMLSVSPQQGKVGLGR
jgi:hypothetical protein